VNRNDAQVLFAVAAAPIDLAEVGRRPGAILMGSWNNVHLNQQQRQSMAITMGDCFIRSSAVISAKLDDDLVLLSLEQDKYFGSGTVGGRIWALLAERKSTQQIIDELVEEFEVTESRCFEEVSEFLEVMVRAGLVIRG
jgi:hypothetical protein